MKIREAKDQMAVIKFASGNYRGFIERECRMRWQTHAVWEIDEKSPPLSALISASDWVVICDTCQESVVINYGEIYFCPNCLNAEYGGKARVVLFPKPKDREQIEMLLVRRPNPNNRNWLPHETIKDIQDENEAHGISGVLE